MNTLSKPKELPELKERPEYELIHIKIDNIYLHDWHTEGNNPLDSYLLQDHFISSAITQQHTQNVFIQTWLKAL